MGIIDLFRAALHLCCVGLTQSGSPKVNLTMPARLLGPAAPCVGLPPPIHTSFLLLINFRRVTQARAKPGGRQWGQDHRRRQLSNKTSRALWWRSEAADTPYTYIPPQPPWLAASRAAFGGRSLGDDATPFNLFV